MASVRGSLKSMSISQGQLSQTQLEDIEVCSWVSMLRGRSRTDVGGRGV